MQERCCVAGIVGAADAYAAMMGSQKTGVWWGHPRLSRSGDVCIQPNHGAERH